ncbi:hypothetical protein RHSIM_Rhsim05G0164900 [Rhododendron simsii]|uniref:Uncharacterized protein n=1 Tax=Rhododendron simsii TaxID=118357 RepID=A0A834GWJ7_RHOSS|nr:hypothetical protein RHSIM_Rhsim05G0164900 [Rhododendron simsii]
MYEYKGGPKVNLTADTDPIDKMKKIPQFDLRKASSKSSYAGKLHDQFLSAPQFCDLEAEDGVYAVQGFIRKTEDGGRDCQRRRASQ